MATHHDPASLLSRADLTAKPYVALCETARAYERRAERAEEDGDYAECESYRATADAARLELLERDRLAYATRLSHRAPRAVAMLGR